MIYCISHPHIEKIYQALSGKHRDLSLKEAGAFIAYEETDRFLVHADHYDYAKSMYPLEQVTVLGASESFEKEPVHVISPFLKLSEIERRLLPSQSRSALLAAATWSSSVAHVFTAVMASFLNAPSTPTIIDLRYDPKGTFSLFSMVSGMRSGHTQAALSNNMAPLNSLREYLNPPGDLILECCTDILKRGSLCVISAPFKGGLDSELLGRMDSIFWITQVEGSKEAEALSGLSKQGAALHMLYVDCTEPCAVDSARTLEAQRPFVEFVEMLGKAF